MASKLSSFPPHYPFRSPLFKTQPESIPSIDELENILSELKVAKQRVVDRRRKADEDVRIVEESIRRMTEKEKGKSKAVDKVKRERDYTPLPDGDDVSLRSSLDPRKLVQKKKKRKREPGDSEGEPELQRPRKMSPVSVHTPTETLSLKPPKPSISVPPSNHKVASAGPDFTLPGPYQLLPQRPPIPQPAKPGPRKPVDVTEDFSIVKAPGQVLVTTFYSSIEPYIRQIREEDVGFLEHSGDEVEPYIMPKLGRHYLEVWEDQDSGILPPVLLDLPTAPPSTFTAPTPKWDPSTLADSDLSVEEKGHGALTERVISALLPIPDMGVWKGVKAAEDAMEGRPGGSGAAAARKERLNVTDLEARIRDMMRHHGLITAMPDFTERVDDPIASALREAQRELRRVVALNKARKARLAAIAQDRLSYQEYIELRDSVDRNINSIYAKLQKKDTPKLGKKKKKPLQGAAAAAHAAANAAATAAKSSCGGSDELGPNFLPPCPAALGLAPDEDNRLTVNEQLKKLVETRRSWVDDVGSVFEMKERENPGRICGLPLESIYNGIEEGVEESLRRHWAKEQQPPNNSVFTRGKGHSSGANLNGIKSKLTNASSHPKGKEKARGDAMDIG